MRFFSRKLLTKPLWAALMVSALFGAIPEDGVEVVTYGNFTYKWKNLVDSLYLQKIEKPYMYYKLGNLSDAFPYFGSFDFGFGTTLGAANDTFLALAGSYKDTTGSFLQSNWVRLRSTNNSFSNGIPLYTNGSASALVTFEGDGDAMMTNLSARTMDFSVGFGKKIGETYLNVIYRPTWVVSAYTMTALSATERRMTNGYASGTVFTNITASGIYDYGSVAHNLSLGFLSGKFEIQGAFGLKNDAASNSTFLTNLNTVSLLGGDGIQRVTNVTTQIGEGWYSTTSSTNLSDLVTRVLPHTYLSFQLNPRFHFSTDARLDLLVDYQAAVFDGAKLTNRLLWQAQNYQTNGNKQIGLTGIENITSYLNPAYERFQGHLRFRKIWKEEGISFGIHPMYAATWSRSTYGRQSIGISRALIDTNGNGITTEAGDTNYTLTLVGGVDTKTVTTWDHDLRFPVAAQWKVSRLFTLYAGATARFQATITTTRTEETAGSAVVSPGSEYLSTSNSLTGLYLAEVPRTTVQETITPALNLVGSYAAGLLFTPGEHVELMVTFNGERPFNKGASGIFTGADLSFIYNF